MQDSSTSSTVVITGASSGIGLGLAEAYLERGFNVVANARTDERLAAAAKQLGNPARFLGVAGDIGQRATAQQLIDRAVERFGQVDVLINNAGIFNAKPFVEYTEEELDQLVATNLKGFVYASQAAAKHMVARRQGHIVNITASIALQPNQQVPAAAAGADQGRHQRRDARAGARTRAAQRQGECGGARHRRHAAVHARAARLPERPVALGPHRVRCARSPTRCSTSRAPISRRAWCCRWTAA